MKSEQNPNFSPKIFSGWLPLLIGTHIVLEVSLSLGLNNLNCLTPVLIVSILSKGEVCCQSGEGVRVVAGI